MASIGHVKRPVAFIDTTSAYLYPLITRYEILGTTKESGVWDFKVSLDTHHQFYWPFMLQMYNKINPGFVLIKVPNVYLGKLIPAKYINVLTVNIWCQSNINVFFKTFILFKFRKKKIGSLIMILFWIKVLKWK